MRRDRQFSMRLSEWEHAEVRRRASEAGMTASGYVRDRSVYDEVPDTATTRQALALCFTIEGIARALHRISRSLDAIERDGAPGAGELADVRDLVTRATASVRDGLDAACDLAEATRPIRIDLCPADHGTGHGGPRVFDHWWER